MGKNVRIEDNRWLRNIFAHFFAYFTDLESFERAIYFGLVLAKGVFGRCRSAKPEKGKKTVLIVL